MVDALWVLVGIFIGSIGGILTISLVSAGKFDDLQNESDRLTNIKNKTINLGN